MNCIHCSGTMRRSKAPFNIDRNGYHLTIQAVPAWICGQCGEPYFEEREVEAIQETILTLDKQTRLLAADVAQP